MRKFVSPAAILIVCFVAGCGDGLLEVSGNVTYEGEAVEQGTISFVDAATSSSVAVPIENGAYTLRTSPGSKRVEIRASRPLPPERQTQPEMGLMYDDYIPAEYNRASTLSANVSESGERTFDFHLKAP